MPRPWRPSRLAVHRAIMRVLARNFVALCSIPCEKIINPEKEMELVTELVEATWRTDHPTRRRNRNA